MEIGVPFTFSHIYEQTRQSLGSKFEADQLFMHVTGKHIIDLRFLKDKPAPEQDVRLLSQLTKRRMNGEPLQYLLGEWEFYGLPFKVGQGVLIPRQDTELLVDVALEKIKDVETPEVLDLCSGSGCVAVAIAHECSASRVTALELSEKAFEYLLQNVEINSNRVRAVRGDLLEYKHPVAVDLLVANPPYIPHETLATLQTEVLHEPIRALDGGKDGLNFYRAIVSLYRNQIKLGGHICMEIGIGQSDQVIEILRLGGFCDCGVRDDLTGIPRVVHAVREK